MDILSQVFREFGVLGLSFAVLLFLAIIFYYFYRAGSIYFFIDRLWKIASGKDKFDNKDIDKLWNEVRDIEAFQFKTRLSIKSLSQVENIKKFVDEKNLVWRDLIPVARYFDVDSLKFRESRYGVWAAGHLIIALITYSLISAPSIFYPRYKNAAYLYFKETNINFEYYGNKVLIKGIEVNKEKCNANSQALDEMIKSGVSTENANAICKSLNSDDKTYYIDTIKQQKAMAIVWGGIFLLLSIIFFRRFWSCLKTWEIKRNIEKIDKDHQLKMKYEARDKKIEDLYKSLPG